MSFGGGGGGSLGISESICCGCRGGVSLRCGIDGLV